MLVAAVRSRSAFTLSVARGLPTPLLRALDGLEVFVTVETDDEWIARVAAGTPTGDGERAVRVPRARIIGEAASRHSLHAALAWAVDGDPDLAIYAGEVTQSGRIELLPFLHEQAISITAHRFGNPDAWSAEVI